MLGVVGKIKINYFFQNETYEEIVDPQAVSEFTLEHCSQVKFQVEEVTYVEDTVYGVTLLIVEPECVSDEIFVGSISAGFNIDKIGIHGKIVLCF